MVQFNSFEQRHPGVSNSLFIDRWWILLLLASAILETSVQQQENPVVNLQQTENTRADSQQTENTGSSSPHKENSGCNLNQP